MSERFTCKRTILPLKEELQLMEPLWDRVKVPAIVIHGKKDDFVPWQNAEFVRAQMPDSLLEIVYLQGMNHFIPWSAPGEIVKGIGWADRRSGGE